MDCAELVAFCFTVIGTIVTIGSIVFAFFLYLREKRNTKIKRLTDQIIAYYSEENVAVNQIAQLTGKNISTIQKDLRKEAMSDDNNKDGIRPYMTPNDAKNLRYNII